TVVFGDDQDRTVVDTLAPEAPLIRDANAELGDVLGLRRGHDQDRDLRALALLERIQLALERVALRGAECRGEVGDALLEARNGNLRLRATEREQRKRGQRAAPDTHRFALRRRG